MQKQHCEYIFLHLCFTKCKSTQETPDLGPGPRFFSTSALLVSAMNDFSPNDKRDWLHRVRAEAHTAQYSPGYRQTASTFGRTEGQGKDITRDPRILPQLPASCDSGISQTCRGVCISTRHSMNLSYHLGAYVNFGNNILGQRFHSLDELHDKERPYLF